MACVCMHVYLCIERARLFIIRKYLLSAYSMPGIIFSVEEKLRLKVYKFTLFEISTTNTRVQIICF